MQKRCPWIMDWHSKSRCSSAFYHLRHELRLFRKVHLHRRKAHIDPVGLNQPHGRFTLKVRNGTIEANCKRGAILIAQRMVDTPAAIGEKRKTERYGTIQHLFDAGAESSVVASRENDDLFAGSYLHADRLQIVLHNALPRRCQPAAKAALATGGFPVRVNDEKAAGIGQNSGEYGRY